MPQGLPTLKGNDAIPLLSVLLGAVAIHPRTRKKDKAQQG
jgi:hypothetical protein